MNSLFFLIFPFMSDFIKDESESFNLVTELFYVVLYDVELQKKNW